MSTEEQKTADFVETLPYYKGCYIRACNRAEKVLKAVKGKGPDLTPIEADMCGKALVGLEEHSTKYEERLLHLVNFDKGNAEARAHTRRPLQT